jgi:ribosomal protein S18 acetylase RimI-like enzyme
MIFMKTQVRKMQISDIATVRRMGFNTPEFNTGTTSDTFYSTRTMRKWVRDPNGVAFSAIVDDNIVGFILGNYLTGSRDGYLNTMVVDQKHRKQGIGRELLRKALEELHKKDCNHIFCVVEEENEKMLRVLKRSGFEVGKSFKYVEIMID